MSRRLGVTVVLAVAVLAGSAACGNRAACLKIVATPKTSNTVGGWPE